MAELDGGPRLSIPVLRWTLLLAVAVGGSLTYGASLGLVLPGWKIGGAALWLTLSAGLAWCIFIPVLWLAMRLPLVRCLDACLFTMAGGEVVLASGALVNALIWWHGLAVNATVINGLVVGFSNVAMVVFLAIQLRRHGIPAGRTVALWMLALNGSGAVFFAVLYRWLEGA